VPGPPERSARAMLPDAPGCVQSNVAPCRKSDQLPSQGRDQRHEVTPALKTKCGVAPAIRRSAIAIHHSRHSGVPVETGGTPTIHDCQSADNIMPRVMTREASIPTFSAARSAAAAASSGQTVKATRGSPHNP